MEGDVAFGIFLPVLSGTHLQILIVNLQGRVKETDLEELADDLGLLMVFVLGLLHFVVEGLYNFLHVVIFYLEVAPGLGDPVLEQLEFGV